MNLVYFPLEFEWDSKKEHHNFRKHGVTFQEAGEYTLKEPALKNLKVNAAETRRIRKLMARQKSIKITININSDTLATFRAIAEETGVPYQRLINRTLLESLERKSTLESRIGSLERQIKEIKKKLAA